MKKLNLVGVDVSAMPQKSRRQNATESRNGQLSVVSCKPLLASASHAVWQGALMRLPH